MAKRGILPVMNQKEANYLLREGYEPIEWVTPRMLSSFWNTTRAVISAAKHRGMYDTVKQLKIGNKTYMEKFGALTAYAPSEVPEDEKFEILKNIPIMMQAEKDSGIYDKIKPTVIPSRKSESLTHAQFRGTTPLYEPDVPVNPTVSGRPLKVTVQEPSSKTQIDKTETKSSYVKEAERFPARKKFEKDYLEAMADIVTLTDWEHIIVRAVNDAIDGDSKARMWLADYLIGKPITRIASIQQVQNSQMSEDERTQYLQAIFSTQMSGEDILDVESFSKDRNGVDDNRIDDANSAEIGGWDTGAEHAVASTSEE